MTRDDTHHIRARVTGGTGLCWSFSETVALEALVYMAGPLMALEALVYMAGPSAYPWIWKLDGPCCGWPHEASVLVHSTLLHDW